MFALRRPSRAEVVTFLPARTIGSGPRPLISKSTFIPTRFVGPVSGTWTINWASSIRTTAREIIDDFKGEKLDYVIPDQTILIQNPIAVTKSAGSSVRSI